MERWKGLELTLGSCFSNITKLSRVEDFFSVSLRCGAVYQLGMHSLVPGKLKIMNLPQAQE